MKDITEKDLRVEEKKWAKQKALIKRKNKIKKEKREERLSFFPKFQTTKVLMAFLFINCSLVEIFTGYVTLKSFDIALVTGMQPDLTPLVSLIGTVVSEVIAFAVYSIKSTRENTRGGIVFENAMRKLEEKQMCKQQEEYCQCEEREEQEESEGDIKG